MSILTNNICKTVKSLDQRKFRKKEMAFKAEGSKCVSDTLGHFRLRSLFATADWLAEHSGLIVDVDSEAIYECKRGDIIKMSSLSTPSDVIAVYDIPESDFSAVDANSNLILALDTIQDPGNLGTIIRVADWFGVRNIICSNETADCFSPKTIQSTMGSISRVRLHYGNLPEMIASLECDRIYGTFLDGKTITDCQLSEHGIIIIGNEGNGISAEVGETVTHRLLIPSYPPGEPTGESLNAAVATAITLAKFRGV